MNNNSIFFPILHEDFYKDFEPWRISHANHPNRSGVYELFANKPICRAVGRDEKGVLYIGKGNVLNYNNRIGLLINSINGTSSQNHEAGIRYNNHEGLKLRYPLSGCEIRITLCENPEKLETEKLDSYYKEHGEYPPLNRVSGIK